MTTVKAPAAQVMSGWCGSGGHGRCRGAYAGCVCPCACHQQSAEPEPVALPARHCVTCACAGHA